MNDLTEIKNQFLEDIDEIKRSINDKSEDTPEEIKKKTNTSNLREAFFALTGGDNYE